MDEKLSEAISKGFRDPADEVTFPCFDYMARIVELRDFIGFFFGAVKTLQNLAENNYAEIKAAYEGPKDEGPIKIPYRYSYHEQFVNEIMLSRAVESFDLYLISVLRLIFLARPEILKSEGKIDIEAVLDLRGPDEIVSYIAERKLHDLAYKPLSDLNDYIRSRTGIELFGSKQTFDIIVVASEVRNLIAHNDCKRNEHFERRTASVSPDLIPSCSPTGKVKLTDDWMRVASYTIDSVVFDFDEAAAKKFSLDARNRFGLFQIRD